MQVIPNRIMQPPPRLPRRYLRPLLIVLAVLLLAIWWWRGNAGTGEEGERETVTVANGSVRDVVTAQGKLEPKAYVDVGLQVSGQIKKLYVDVGDGVRQGQLLVDIDPRLYESQMAKDSAQLKSLQAQRREQTATLELARRQQQRNQTMHTAKAISRDALDQGEAALKMAEAQLGSLDAQIEQAEAQLAVDKTNLGFTKIYAPIDGVVATLPVREGQTLNSVQSAPTLMQLADLNVMTVRAQVAEADVPRVTVGMAATFNTLGEMEKKWQGRVRLVQPSPQVINDVVLYDVLIDVDNPERRLMNGMSTQVFFELGAAKNVPVLPLEALGPRQADADSRQGRAYQVEVQGKDGIKKRRVYVGVRDRVQAEIRAGLKAGEVVVLPQRAKPVPPGSQRGGMPPGMGGPKL